MSRPASRRELGEYGERIAREFLVKQGFALVASNWRCRQGELDLVMRHGDLLVVVEVRCRADRPVEDAVASVTPAKLSKLRAATRAYLARSHLGDSLPVRLDLVAIGGPVSSPKIRWLKGFC